MSTDTADPASPAKTEVPHGSVWTRDTNKGMALARKMNTGTVNINNVIANVFQFPVPMEGWNDSGVGSRSGGAAGIRKFCRTKSIVAE